MTVPTPLSSVIYTSTGVTATYAYTWGIVQDADLVVYQIPVDGLIIARLVLTSDYTVTGAGFPAGGTITLTAGIPASGIRIFIASDPEQIQEVLLQQGAAFNPADVMAALDLLTREVQANRRLIDGCVRFPVAESLDGLTSQLAPAAARASGTVMTDAAGNIFVGSGASPDVTISAAMVPVVQASTTAAALALLGGLPLAGGTMTGDIAMGGHKVTGLGAPSAGGDATNKTYVDAQDALHLPLAGGTMSGPIAMGTSKITGLGTPVAGTDAATKAYVDALVVANPAIAKAWVVFSDAGYATPDAAFGISGITKNATGDYTIAFSVAQPDANYVVLATPTRISSSTLVNVSSVSPPTTTEFRILVKHANPDDTDVDQFTAAASSRISVMVFGN